MKDSAARADTTGNWLGFWAVFLLLAALDVFCLAPASGKAISARTAGLHCVFWFFVGIGFNVIVWLELGREEAIVWFNGYILEYLLSMDNVFFFHVVFTAYGTPPGQVYKALFLGILGAVVLRLAFYFVGAEFFRLAFLVQVIFGLILIWSGYATITSSDEDDDPRENRCVKLITRILPFTESYDDNGALFTRAQAGAVQCATGEVIGVPSAADVEAPLSQRRRRGMDQEDDQPMEDECCEQAHMLGDPSTTEAGTGGSPVVSDSRIMWRGTLLLLVVLVLQVVDLVFAVDSVTAKIAENDSIFLDFTSSAFAMLCLRSMYFVMVKLMKYFRFLKFGVGLILALIGVKLIIGHWVEIPSIWSMIFIVATFAASIVLSILYPEVDDGKEEVVDGKAEADVGAANRS